MRIIIAGTDPAALLAGIVLTKNLPDADIVFVSADTSNGAPGAIVANPVVKQLPFTAPDIQAAIEDATHRAKGVRVLRAEGKAGPEDCSIPGLEYAFVRVAHLRETLSALAREAECLFYEGTAASGTAKADLVLIPNWRALHELGVDTSAFGRMEPNSSRLLRHFALEAGVPSLTIGFAGSDASPLTAIAMPLGKDKSSLTIEAELKILEADGWVDAPDPELQARLGALFPQLPVKTLAPAHGWQSSATHTVETRLSGNIVLFGDAAATIHHSIGLQQYFALEEGHSLAETIANAVSGKLDLHAVLQDWQARRATRTASYNRAAAASAEWIATAHRAFHLPMEQFSFACVSRSLRIGYKRVRDAAPDFTQRLDTCVAGTPAPGANAPLPPMFAPYELRGMKMINRMVFSPMCMYSAVDGTVNDFHLAHLGARAVGGFGLVIAEMTNVTAQGRMTPGCAGMYAPEHVPAWKRITDFTHQHTQAKIGIQLAHAGRKGSIGRSWEKYDPVKGEEMWEVIAPSALPFTPDRPTPREMTSADIKKTVDAFARAARMSEEAGFDMIELHLAHGYLLSEFISPLSNKRSDAYGGSLTNRMRFPLEVLEAVRAAFPDDKPIAARISANDFRPDGVTPEESIEIARMLREAGCDIVAVSTAGVTSDRRPAAMNRLYQLALSEAIRHAAKVPTMAIGGIVSHTDCNMIIASGRADLCVMARGAMNQPYFPHHAANEQGYRFEWPMPYARADETVIKPS